MKNFDDNCNENNTIIQEVELCEQLSNRLHEHDSNKEPKKPSTSINNYYDLTKGSYTGTGTFTAVIWTNKWFYCSSNAEIKYDVYIGNWESRVQRSARVDLYDLTDDTIAAVGTTFYQHWDNVNGVYRNAWRAAKFINLREGHKYCFRVEKSHDGINASLSITLSH